MKILLCNSISDMSVDDIYRGYCRAFDYHKVNYMGYDWAEKRHTLSDDVCVRLLHSLLMQEENGYTHLLMINCFELPDWFLRSVRQRKILYCVDDPWSGWIYQQRSHLYDEIYTQEIEVALKYRYNYLPVAFDSLQPLPEKDVSIQSDVCFVGSLYPDRLAFLKKLLPKIRGLTWRGIGPLSKDVDQDDPWIKQYWVTRGVQHSDYLLYTINTRVAINLHRDPTWQCDGIAGTKSLTETANSLNPRIYENLNLLVPTVSDNRRSELKELFPNYFTFETPTECANLISRLLERNPKTWELMAEMKEIASKHTYLRRAEKWLRALDINDPDNNLKDYINRMKKVCANLS